jgi:hypothetical protein
VTELQTDRSTFDAFVFDVGGIVVGHDNEKLCNRLVSRCKPACRPEQIGAILQLPKWENASMEFRDGYRMPSFDLLSRGWRTRGFALRRSCLSRVRGLRRWPER